MILVLVECSECGKQIEIPPGAMAEHDPCPKAQRGRLGIYRKVEPE